MSGRFLMGVLLGLSLWGCAHPRYEETAPASPQESAEDPLASCDLEFTKSHFCASLNWEKKPTEEEAGSFVLEFHGDRDPSQFVELIYPLVVVLWMPSMGHGSAPVTVESLGMGQYRISKVFFIMHGDWEIKIQIKSGQDVLDEVVLPYRF